MKNIQNAQSQLVNDSCNDCGSYADIGAVIDEHDTILVINVNSAQADAEAKVLSDKAQARFDDVVVLSKATNEGVELSITFNYSAEKMIFQLENSF